MHCVASDLERHGRQWALVGGFAVSARGVPRFTRDIDVAVMVDDDADGEGLVRSLIADRYRLLASVEQDETGRLANGAARLDHASDAVRLISASGFNRRRDLTAALKDIGNPSRQASNKP